MPPGGGEHVKHGILFIAAHCVQVGVLMPRVYLNNHSHLWKWKFLKEKFLLRIH